MPGRDKTSLGGLSFGKMFTCHPDSGNEKLLNALFPLCHTKFRLELHVLFVCCTSTVGSHLSEHDQEELGMLKQHYLTKQSSFHLMHSKIPI